MDVENNTSKLKSMVQSLKLRKHFNELAPMMVLIFTIGWMASFGFIDCYPADPSLLVETEAPSIETLVNLNETAIPNIDVLSMDLITKKPNLPKNPNVITPVINEAECESIEPTDDASEELTEPPVEVNDQDISEEANDQTEPKEPETFVELKVTFTVTNDIVYARGGLNGRYGPHKDWGIKKKIPAGTQLFRIAVGKNGWDKVLYEDEVVYIWHEFLHSEL